MRRIELVIDVTGSTSLTGKTEIAATAFLPDPALVGKQALAMFAFPGGGYSRGYYDMHFAGHEGYSEAQFHTGLGTIFIALDHLGVGESSVSALSTMHIEDIAAANDAAVREIAARLEQGRLAEGFPALPDLFKVGTGQSMGGGLTMIMQGRHGTYHAIAPFGYSAIHTVLPQKDESDRQKGMQGHGRTAGRDTDPSKLSLLESSRSTADYTYPFHWEDVPQDILAADMAGGYPIRKMAPKWGSVTIPNCVIAMMSPGYVTEEVARITVPVLIGYGERDTAPTPLSEPAAFKKAIDVSVFMVPQMAHMHNFASTRKQLWQRLHDWSRMVARPAG
jgi:pimeloyl-ACP methyl ester carboxylesterase